MEQPISARTTVAGALAVAGGVLALVSSFLHWGRVASGLAFPAQLNVAVKGGGLVLGLGVALAGAGAAMFALRSRVWRIWLGVIAIAAGLFVAGIGAYFAASDTPYLETTARFVADRTGGNADRIERILSNFVDRGALDVSRDFAVYLALAGGVIGFVGGIVQASSGSVNRAPAMPEAPGPVAGWGPVPPGGPGAQEPPPPAPGPGPAPPEIPPPGPPFRE